MKKTLLLALLASLFTGSLYCAQGQLVLIPDDTRVRTSIKPEAEKKFTITFTEQMSLYRKAELTVDAVEAFLKKAQLVPERTSNPDEVTAFLITAEAKELESAALVTNTASQLHALSLGDLENRYAALLLLANLYSDEASRKRLLDQAQSLLGSFENKIGFLKESAVNQSLAVKIKKFVGKDEIKAPPAKPAGPSLASRNNHFRMYSWIAATATIACIAAAALWHVAIKHKKANRQSQKTSTLLKR